MNTKEKSKLRLLVDGEEGAVTAKGAFPLASPAASPSKVVEMSGEAFERSMQNTVATVLSAVDGISGETKQFAVSELTFSLAFDASGEVSILSLAKGTLGAKAGIEIKLTRK